MGIPTQALLIVSLFLVAASVSSEELNFHPGEWEFTSELAVRGDPRATQEWTESKCVSVDELRSGKLFMGKLDISGCDPGELQLTDDRMQWQFDCLDSPMGRRIEAEVTVRLFGNRFEGVTEAEVTTARGALYVTTQFEGHRKGSCE